MSTESSFRYEALIDAAYKLESMGGKPAPGETPGMWAARQLRDIAAREREL